MVCDVAAALWPCNAADAMIDWTDNCACLPYVKMIRTGTLGTRLPEACRRAVAMLNSATLSQKGNPDHNFAVLLKSDSQPYEFHAMQ